MEPTQRIIMADLEHLVDIMEILEAKAEASQGKTEAI
jgi:hypothetical protein